jgi:hypothetical protein
VEKIGFFKDDPQEAVAALEQQVFVKKLMGGPEGLEIAPAGPNPGIGAALRRGQASVRLDIPSLWRALIRKPQERGKGPVVSILAPKGKSVTDAQAAVSSARGAPPEAVVGEDLDCIFPPGTPAKDLVQFAVEVLEKIGGPVPVRPAGPVADVYREWQWSVRGKGLVPR